MSKALDFRKSAGTDAASFSLPDSDREAYPNIATLLLGVPGKASGTWDTPPHTVVIFVEGGRLKAIVGAGDENPKFFTTVNQLEGFLDDLELCLETNKGEWKPAKGKNGPRRF